jgi:hypothetical protein
MVTLAALVVLGLATFLVSRVLPARRELLVLAVLALPILLELPHTLHHEAVEVRQNRHVNASTGEVAAAFLRGPTHTAGRLDEFKFLLVVRDVVPPDAQIGFTADPNQTWIRWAAWGLAPRLLIPGTDARWLVARDPSSATNLGRELVRVGRFSLVAR